MQRVREHLLDGPLLDDLARVHDEDVVGDVARAREVVRDVEERDLMLLLQLRHQVQDPDPDRDVEHARRLVGEDDLRLDRERARDRDALALAARELVRILRRDLVGRDEPDALEQLVDALRRRASRGTTLWMRSGRSMWWRIGLDRVQRAERVLEDDLHLRAVVQDVAAGRARVETSPPSKRTLPSLGSISRARSRATVLLPLPLSPTSAVTVPGTQLERDVVDRVQARAMQRAADREVLREAANLERSAGRHSPSPATRWHATS